MTKCILIFEEFQNCLNLILKFEENSISVSEATVVSPAVKNITDSQRQLIKENEKVQFNIFPLPNLEINKAILDFNKVSEIKTNKILIYPNIFRIYDFIRKYKCGDKLY